jgi:hypothetical protein
MKFSILSEPAQNIWEFIHIALVVKHTKKETLKVGKEECVKQEKEEIGTKKKEKNKALI